MTWSAQLPLTQRLSLLGRAGLQYTKATTRFTGNRLNALGHPNPPNEGRRNGKVGVGVEYKLTEALALRGEVERLRVNDAAGNRGDIDVGSVSLVYKFGRPAAAAYVAPVAAPVAAPQEAPAAAPVVPRRRQRQCRKRYRSQLKRCSTSTRLSSNQTAKPRWTS